MLQAKICRDRPLFDDVIDEPLDWQSLDGTGCYSMRSMRIKQLCWVVLQGPLMGVSV
jgi:hypothetical protein